MLNPKRGATPTRSDSVIIPVIKTDVLLFGMREFFQNIFSLDIT